MPPNSRVLEEPPRAAARAGHALASCWCCPCEELGFGIAGC